MKVRGVFAVAVFILVSVSLLMGSYDEATYLSLMIISPVAVQDGYILGIVNANTPGGGNDSTFDGLVDIRATEEFPNSSVELYAMGPGTIYPVDYIDLSEDMPVFFLKDTESEYVILQAYDPEGNLKASAPIAIYVEPKGGEATHLELRTPERASVGEESFFFSSVVAVDDNGRIDPTYAVVDPSFPIAFGVVTLEVISEENPDSSAWVGSLFGEESTHSIDVPLITGMGFFIVGNEEVESATFQAFSVATYPYEPIDDSSPVEVEFVPEDEGIFAIPFSFALFRLITNLGQM